VGSALYVGPKYLELGKANLVVDFTELELSF